MAGPPNGALDLPRLCANLACLSYTPLVATATRTNVPLLARQVSAGVGCDTRSQMELLHLA